MATFQIRDMMVSLQQDLCNVSKGIVLTNVFLCNASNLISCIQSATAEDLASVKEQMIQALFAIQQAESGLELESEGGEPVPATPEELGMLSDRVQAVLDLIESQ